MDFLNFSCHQVYRHIHLLNSISNLIRFFHTLSTLGLNVVLKQLFEHFMFPESNMVGHNKCEVFFRGSML